MRITGVCLPACCPHSQPGSCPSTATALFDRRHASTSCTTEQSSLRGSLHSTTHCWQQQRGSARCRALVEGHAATAGRLAGIPHQQRERSSSGQPLPCCKPGRRRRRRRRLGSSCRLCWRRWPACAGEATRWLAETRGQGWQLKLSDTLEFHTTSKLVILAGVSGTRRQCSRQVCTGGVSWRLGIPLWPQACKRCSNCSPGRATAAALPGQLSAA